MLLDYQFAALAQGEGDVKAGVNKILGEVEALQQSVGQAYSTWDSQSTRARTRACSGTGTPPRPRSGPR